MAILLLLVAIAAIGWGLGRANALKTAEAKLQDFARRYKPAMDIDRHVRPESDHLTSASKGAGKASPILTVAAQTFFKYYLP